MKHLIVYKVYRMLLLPLRNFHQMHFSYPECLEQAQEYILCDHF